MFNNHHKSIRLRIALALTLLAGVFEVSPVRARATIGNETISETGFLHEDGTLNLETDLPSSFPTEGWDVQLDPQRGPIFSSPTHDALSMVATTAGNWSALGSNLDGTDGAISNPGPPGIAQEIDVIAVSGTDVYVGGCFQNAGGDPTADYVAKWDGTSWSGIGNDGTATPNGAVKSCIRALAVNGENVYVGGYPNAWNDGAPAPQATYAAKWDGTSWSGLGLSLDNQVTSIAISSENVYIGGYFAGYVLKWNGTSWSTLGGSGALNGGVEVMKLINSDLYVGGFFTAVYNGLDLVPEAAHIAKWDTLTENWSALGSNGDLPGGSIDDTVWGLASDGSNLYIAGQFKDINNYGTILSAADYIAKWDGVNWSALGNNGAGNGSLNYPPIAIQINGSDVYVGYMFTDVNNYGTVLTAADYVAKWDSLTGNWSALGSNGGGNGSLNHVVHALGLLGDKLLVGGRFTDVNNNGTVLNTADYIAAYDTCTSGIITVQNINDVGAGSLRQAIADVCSGGTINFDASLSGKTITLVSTLVIDKDLTIDGSVLASKISINGNDNVAVFHGASGVTATLDSLIIKNGRSSGLGGGIYNAGSLTIKHSTFAQNQAIGNYYPMGGAIANYGGALDITDSLFTENRVVFDSQVMGGGYGGAIYNINGSLTIAGSIFNDNDASRGGAISCQGGTMNITNTSYFSNTAVDQAEAGDGGAIYNTCNSTVTNSTFSANNASHNGGAIISDNDINPLMVTNSTFYGNSAANVAGGIANYGGLLVVNSTFSGNSSLNGGAIRNGLGGVLSLRSSILANSLGSVDCINTSEIESINNLIETTGPDLETSCGVPYLSSDPVLGPLQDNDGFTQTMALMPGSPAIDAGDDGSCPETDQRGVSRPQGSHCDIGAYEYDSADISVTIGGQPMGSYTVASGQERREYYPVSGGPVVVESTNGVDLVSAIRLQSYANDTLYSFVETMGVPSGLLSYKYYFPTYNNTWAPLNSQLRFANINDTPLDVKVSIGSDSWTYAVPAHAERREYLSVSGGPVIVESLDPTKKIIAAIRLQSLADNTLYSFAETMGIPFAQLSDTYYFPTYNNTWAPLNSQIRFGNLASTTTRIRVTIGGNIVWEEDVPGLAERRLYFDVSGGPVKVESLDPSKKIVAAIRLQSYANNTLYSFVETMGVPSGLLSHKYYFPTYNNTWAPLNSQIRFGNLESTTTRIRVTIGGVNVWEQDVPGLAERRLYFPVSGGPVIIESLDTSKKIVAAIRLQSYANDTLYSFAEALGIPAAQLSDTYYFPTYNNTWPPLNSQLRFGVP